MEVPSPTQCRTLAHPVMPNLKGREMLRGMEEQIFDMVCEGTSPEQWAAWLRAPLEQASARGAKGLAATLVGAGGLGAFGSAVHQAVSAGHEPPTGDHGLLLLAPPVTPTAEGGSGLVDAPIHVAAALGQERMLRALLQEGRGDSNALDSKGYAPIHLAVVHGHLSVAEVLLAAGADLKLRVGESELSAVDLAARHERVAILTAMLGTGADANASSPLTGCTALHYAATSNQVGAIDTLVEAGASVDAPNKNLWTPLLYASDRDRAEAAVALLKHGADINKLTNRGRTPLRLATDHGHLAVVRLLLAAGADVSHRSGEAQHSAMDAAARFGRVQALKALIDHGAEVNTASPVGGYVALHQAAYADHAVVIDLLAGAGADCDKQSYNGFAPLHTAALYGSSEATRALLKNGARPNARNKEGRTALHLAASKAGREGAADCVDSLLRGGADETAVDTRRKTAADFLGRRAMAAGEQRRVSLSEDNAEFDRVRKLLEDAPADRAWRRRGLLVVCRAQTQRMMGVRVRDHENPPGLIVPKTRHHSAGSYLEKGAGLAAGLAAGGANGSRTHGRSVEDVAAGIVGLEDGCVFRKIVGYL